MSRPALYYDAAAMPTEGELETDLTRFRRLYQALVEARENIGAEELPAVDTPVTGTEAMRFRWHLRAERSRALATKAKAIHGTACQVCDVDMEQKYGPIGSGYIEAHHLTPFAELDGRPTELDPATDFAVVCPNCHRMIHKGPPFAIAELRAMLDIATGAAVQT